MPLAYILIICYLIIERWLRKGKEATEFKTARWDNGSSQVIWLVGVLSLVLLLSAPFLNSNQIGYLNSPNIAWLGIVSMLVGLALRYWAAKTLGRFYTRTLQIVEKQQLIDLPPYNLIRHPGYFGTLLIELGAAIAINNSILILIVAIAGIFWRIYRIEAEEKMLATFFAEEYRVYTSKTWKLIPFVY